MEATEFYELLNEYPVVRKADYCSDSWIEHNNIYVHSKNLSTSNSDIDMKNDDIQEISTTDSSQDFYTQLDEYLSANHLSGKKQAILSSFKQNLSQIVDSLNLEDIGDIERLADQCQ